MTTREPTPAADENALIAERRAKLARLREAGVAYPNDFRRDALAADLHATCGERSDEWLGANPVRVRVAGRMMFKRVMGKASFAKLQDSSGQIQVYLQSEALGSRLRGIQGLGRRRHRRGAGRADAHARRRAVGARRVRAAPRQGAPAAARQVAWPRGHRDALSAALRGPDRQRARRARSSRRARASSATCATSWTRRASSKSRRR